MDGSRGSGHLAKQRLERRFDDFVAELEDAFDLASQAPQDAENLRQVLVHAS